MTTAIRTAWVRGVVFGTALLVGSGLAGTARAEEGVEKAVSVAVGYGGEQNDTVRVAGGGSTAGGDGGLLGFTGLLSVGPVAFGGSVELSSSVNGIGNSTKGALAGVRLPVSPRLRLMVLGEAGARRFSDNADFIFVDTVSPSEITLPYVGGRVGLTWLVLKHMDLGVMAFARTDLGKETMVVTSEAFLGPATSTTQEVGGFAAGIVFQVGFRFDTTRPMINAVP
jgi:hypothetical protein